MSALDKAIADENTISALRAICQCIKCNIVSLDNVYCPGSCQGTQTHPPGTYCHKCKCNNCLIQPIPMLKEHLNKALFQCANRNKGCTSLLKYDSLITHQNNCEFNSSKWNNKNDNENDLEPRKFHSVLTNLSREAFPNLDFVTQDSSALYVGNSDKLIESILLY